MVDIPKQKYNGSIRETTIGSGDSAIKVGGETSYPFYLFEGEMPNAPKIAFEVNDVPPTEWAPALNDVYSDVYSDPVAWAKKCIDEFGADMIHLELVGTDPNGQDLSVDHAVDVVKKLIDAITVPLSVWGSTNTVKDGEVLRAVAESCEGCNLLIGPIQEDNYKQIGAGVIGYGHKAIASTPIDINLAKQLNILLGNLGVADESLVVDPTVGGLGYGMEYSYSVIERARQAALTQQDDKLQYPLYCNLGKEVWKVKEAKQTVEEAPMLGDSLKRGILMESITAMAVLLAGGDVLVMRHPESVKLIREIIGELMAA
jgi:acetyl-CoA decarbonylase/synthase, CODH/ACS complex subunit delta